jgi:mono/diheme cytochrome c family protein
MGRKMFILLAVTAALALSATVSAEDNGNKLYDAKCANCHGPDGRAKTAAAEKMKVANLRSPEVQKQSDDELYETIAKGKNHKQYRHAFLYTGMTEKQIRAVIAHVRTFK